MPTRRDFLQTSILATAGYGLTSCVSAEHQANTMQSLKNTRPNMVYILCDDLGYGDLSGYGHPIIQTPYLDQLADEGIKLTDCYAAAPVCSPARAGIMTGRNPYRCHIPDWIPPNSHIHLKEQEISVARLLKQAGYTTAHVGKWHLNSMMDGTEPTPADHGFDLWFSTQNNARPSHRNPENFLRNGNPMGVQEGYSSTLIVDESIRFLNQVKDQPFALFVWFHSPHEPVATADEFQQIYSFVQDKNKAIYYGNVTQMDYETGRLLKTLDQMGLRDNTLVMFTSDNGPETYNRYRGAQHSHGSPGPLRGMKLHMHEGGIRVPGMIRLPGITKPNTISNEPVNGTDLLPTLCEMSGVSIPSDRTIDGSSMLPLFLQKPIHRDEPLYWRYDRALSHAKLAMRQGDWKILADLEFQQIELYNLRDDLKEKHNLAKKHPAKTKSMLADLKAIHTDVEIDPISNEES